MPKIAPDTLGERLNSSSSCNQGDDKQNKENKKDDFSDSNGGRYDPKETENSCYDRNDQE
jgi:hypothetical protein